MISEAAADMLSGEDSVTRDTWRGVTTVTRNTARDTGDDTHDTGWPPSHTRPRLPAAARISR